jgi:Tfp pilus assembly protein PilF
VSETYNNIGNVYDSQGKHDEALVEYQKSLDIKIQVVGHVHPDVAITKQNIGLCFISTNRKQEAKEMFKQAADIRRQVFGPAHALTKKSERLASE